MTEHEEKRKPAPDDEDEAAQPRPATDEPPAKEDEDARVDRDADETFPASDPPANY